MSRFIDEINVITNGILTKDRRYKIIDPLGYYVIFIEEIIEEVLDSGSTPSPLRKTKKKKKLIKRIILKIRCNDDVECEITKEVVVDDINLYVSDVKVIESQKNIELTLTNPKIDDVESKKIIKISF